jgi:hypothetical protein
MKEPKLPRAIYGDGLPLAVLDAVTTLAIVISKHSPAMKTDICEMLNVRFSQHQGIVDEHGSALNANAAEVLRLILMQMDCTDIPDHQ